MARRRMIDPHFWESGDVAKLSIFARFVLVGMFSKADDDGRGVGSAIYLRNTMFPYDDVPLPKMQEALCEISERIAVVLYEVDGNEYYQFTNWKKWQRVDKPKPSILPPPPEDIQPQSKKNDTDKQGENDSNTDSKIDSENDSGLNQNKSKEAKGKEENLRACVHESGDDNDTPKYFPAVGEYFEQHVRAATRRDMEILETLCLKFSKTEICSAIDKTSGKGHSAAYVESVLKSTDHGKGPPGNNKFSNPDYYKNAKW